MSASWHGIVKKIDDYRWEIPTSYKQGMNVPGLIFTSESMLSHILEEEAVQQVANVAFLPGIVGYSLAIQGQGRGSIAGGCRL
ncbi:MAG: tRNA-splicing ligase RtcB [Dehalococcoidales bacterium]|nr:tRNA-splicing ligase RtcB [Dehalococcoidales bacterium]